MVSVPAAGQIQRGLSPPIDRPRLHRSSRAWQQMQRVRVASQLAGAEVDHHSGIATRFERLTQRFLQALRLGIGHPRAQ